MKFIRFTALAFGAILALQAHAATGRYDLTDVAANASAPKALNASGQVAYNVYNTFDMVVTGPNGVGSFNPCPPAPATCAVWGLDDAGDVAIRVTGTKWPAGTSALAHFDGSNLRKLVDANGTAGVTALSHAGKMTGDDGQTVFRGRVQNKHVKDVALPAGFYRAMARAINDRRQIVGEISADSGGSHILLALADGSPMQDLGGLAAGNSEYSTANAISNNGYIVGYANVTTNEAVHAPLGIYFHAVLARVGVPGLTDLGTLDGGGYGFSSYAQGVNSAGTVVGISEKNEDVDTAFVLNVGDMVMTDLNTLVDLPAGVHLDAAWQINEAGQITASGSDGHLYLLTPR